MKKNLKEYSAYIDKAIDMLNTDIKQEDKPEIEKKCKDMLGRIYADLSSTASQIESMQKGTHMSKILNVIKIYGLKRMNRKQAIYYVQCRGIQRMIEKKIIKH